MMPPLPRMLMRGKLNLRQHRSLPTAVGVENGIPNVRLAFIQLLFHNQTGFTPVVTNQGEQLHPVAG